MHATFSTRIRKALSGVVLLGKGTYFSQFRRQPHIILPSILVIALLSACVPLSVSGTSVVPSQSTPTTLPDNTPTSENGIQEGQLVNYIVHELAGNEKQHRFVVSVKAQDTRAPLPITVDVIQRCWLYQDDNLDNCSSEDFINSIHGENATSWNYSYVIFSIITVDSNNSRATVRLDEIFGTGTSRGLLYTLVRLNDTWQIESRKILWSS